MTAPASIPFAVTLRRGAVTAVEDDGARVTVTLTGEAPESVQAAVVSMGGRSPAVGAEVLVAATATAEWFVLGALGVAPPTVVTGDGVSASVERDGAAEVLRVRDAAGRVLVEHAGGRTVVRAAEGDLELRADAGSVRVVARDAVELGAPRLRLTAERMTVTAQALETRAGRVVERAKEAYLDVEGTLQQRVGRYRVLAKDAWQALAGRVVMRSRGDVRVDGEKLYLG